MQVKTLPSLLDQINIRTPKKINPHSAIAEEIIEQQCRELGIWMPHLEGYTTMSGYLFPTTSLQRLVTLGLYFNLMFYIDDVYDRHNKEEVNLEQEIKMRKVFDNCTQIFLKGITPKEPHILYQACIELRRQYLQLTSEEWLKRFMSSNLQHLKASTYTLDDIINSNNDIVEGYIHLRILDAGMYPMIDTLEFARGIMLPDPVINSAYLLEMREYVARIGALMNDIFSYTKEIIGTKSRFNLICVLEDYAGYSFEGAVRKCIEIVNDDIDDFYDLAQNIPSFGDRQVDKDVASYVEGLIDEVEACWHWQISTNRYRSDDSPFPELRTQL